MPNRILKESICTSDNLDRLRAEEEVFFYRLLVNCDDFGRMDARAQILKAKCYPLRTEKIALDQINLWLAALVNADLIIVYQVDDGLYLQVCKWHKHQQRRANKSKYPSIDDERAQPISFDGTCNQLQSDDFNCNQLISDDIGCNQLQSNVPVLEFENRESNTNSNTSPKQKRGPLIKFADTVRLTQKEYDHLVAEFEEEGAKSLVSILDNYKGSKGRTYKDDYKAIHSWVIGRYKEDLARQPSKQMPKTPTVGVAADDNDDPPLRTDRCGFGV